MTKPIHIVRYGELVPCKTAFIDAHTPGSDKKENFTFIFDTINTSLVNPYYCFLMASFISELKRNDTQYLNDTRHTQS